MINYLSWKNVFAWYQHNDVVLPFLKMINNVWKTDQNIVLRNQKINGLERTFPKHFTQKH